VCADARPDLGFKAVFVRSIVDFPQKGPDDDRSLWRGAGEDEPRCFPGSRERRDVGRDDPCPFQRVAEPARLGPSFMDEPGISARANPPWGLTRRERVPVTNDENRRHLGAAHEMRIAVLGDQGFGEGDIVGGIDSGHRKDRRVDLHCLDRHAVLEETQLFKTF